MPVEPMLHFGPFALDVLNERLWRGTELVPLRPKPFLLLRYLVEQAGRLVTKAELLQAVWPETVVSAGVLKAYIHDLRAVLGDDPHVPQFIETVGRRGYRFIAPVREITAEGPPQARPVAQESARQDQGAAPFLPASSAIVVGREAELGHLHRWWAQARAGIRQVVFVTGEAGIGKTTVVDTFVAQAVRAQACWLGQGQCIEHFGAGEAYLPVLSALGQLCRGPDHEHLRALLGQHAPTWLAQMPALLNAAEQEALQRRTLGATRERMLRELTEALEVLTAEQPLVLVVEDLHWSDYATLDLLAFVARRSGPARLLVIGTYRPVEVILREHPLKRVKQELQLHGQCQELALEFLPEGAVAAYLAARFPGQQVPAALVRVLYQCTEGNPLFLVTMVEELLRQGLLVPAGQDLLLSDTTAGMLPVPETLHQMLEQQVERLSAAEQQILEAASMAGAEFSAAAVAAGLATPVEDVEQRCAALARHGQFVRALGTAEWPDGTVATRYGFLHALYQEVLTARVTAGQRVTLHRRIGEREEHAYGVRASELAAELAMHFEQGREHGKAVQYLQQAGQRASQRSAYVEAIAHLTKGLELLKTLPNTTERAQQELRLLRALGPALMSLKGFAAPEVEQTYARACELGQQSGSPQQLLSVQQGLQVCYLVRGEVRKARDLAEQSLRLAQRISTPTALMAGHGSLVDPLYYLGELTTAREHLEQAWALYTAQDHHLQVSERWIEPRVGLLTYLALTSWLLGYPDQAQQRLQEGLARAEQQSYLYSLAGAWLFACSLHCFQQEWQRAGERAEAVIRLATQQGYPYFVANGVAVRGRVLAEQGQVEEGIAQMQQGLAALRATGTELARAVHLSGLAAAYGRGGRVEEGLAVLAEALAMVDHTGIRVHEVELHETKGWLLLARAGDHQAQAEACFQQAINIARAQSAKSLELRAVMSLARLWQQQGKQKEAHRMLAEIYGWFTEGFDTKDLQEAQALLHALS